MHAAPALAELPKAQDALLRPEHAFHIMRSTPNSPLQTAADAGDAGAQTRAMETYIAENSVVGNRVDGANAQALAAQLRGGTGAHRGLMHASLTPQQLPRCPRCLITGGCGGRRRACLGHCFLLRNSTIFGCEDLVPPQNVTCPPEVDPGTLLTRPPDGLAEFDAIRVAAGAPYMGCANVAGRGSGCPLPGTLARVGGRVVNAEVIASECKAQIFEPSCVDRFGKRPFNPFGLCDCHMDVFAVGRVVKACNVSEMLLHAGLGSLRVGNISNVTVGVQQNETVTDFAVIDPESDVAALSYKIPVNTSEGEVNVTLEYFFGEVGVSSGDGLIAEEVIEPEPEL